MNTLSLMTIHSDGITPVLSSSAMCSPAGARALVLMARSCRLFGLKGQVNGLGKESKEPSMVVKAAMAMCKDFGVIRFPVTKGDGWCWTRMVAWASDAIHVGKHLVHKTIDDGVNAAVRKQRTIVQAGGALAEDSMLVLVEPGVYTELVLIGEGQRVSIWRCDRESEANKTEMQKLEWRSEDKATLVVSGNAFINVTGVHMSAKKSHDFVGPGFFCANAQSGATLSLERCDVTCESLRVVEVHGAGTNAFLVGSCIHSGGQGGVNIHGKAKARLEHNYIHSNTLSGVIVADERTEAVLRSNCIHLCKKNGVSVFNKAKATLENNDIHSNGETGVHVQGEGSEVELSGNHIHHGKAVGVAIHIKARAHLKHNIITDNDLAGVEIDNRWPCRPPKLMSNTIKGNGHCTVERSALMIAGWPEHHIAAFHSVGFPGVMCLKNTFFPPGNNVIEGNGKCCNVLGN